MAGPTASHQRRSGIGIKFVEIYIGKDGQVTGPYRLNEIQARLEDAHFDGTELACHEGLDEWVAVREVVGDGREGEGEIVATTDDDKSSADVFEYAIRETLEKPEGELTKADLEKLTYLTLHRNRLTELPKSLEKLTQLTHLWLNSNQLTNLKGLEKLTQLKHLYLQSNQLTNVKELEKLTRLKVLCLDYNPDLTKAQIAELQKALPKWPKCEIRHNATK